MKGYIDNYNFSELDCMKYWQPPASWSKEKRKQETINRIFSGSWLGARKIDGALYVFLKDEDGNITLRGRAKSVNGEYINKWDHLPHLHTWAETLPNGCCFLGEVYWEGHEGSNHTTSIMNCLSKKAIERQEKNENKLHYYIFDILAYDGESWLKKPAKERFNNITNCINLINASSYSWQSYIEGAQYKSGQELWNLLQNLLANDYEGVVIIKEDALYEPGKRPSKTTLKIKKELRETIDCFFTGRITKPTKEYTGKDIEHWQYWVNTYTDERIPVGEHYYESSVKDALYTAVTKPYYYNWAGSLEIGVMNGDKIKPIGYLSGLSDEIKMNYKDYRYKVIEVGAMQFTEDGALRHGKMLGWRSDKNWQECTIEQIKNI